jgi:hypothetical protein
LLNFYLLIFFYFFYFYYSSSHKGNANQKHTKNPPHPCYNTYLQKHHQQHVLARMWGKINPHRLLVGMQAGATMLEKILEAS